MYKGKYLLSDVDGTLMNEVGEIPIENIKAIKHFCDNGGKFGLATGRSIITARHIALKVGVNAPCVLFNGAMVYDFNTDEIITVNKLPEHARELLKSILTTFPNYRATVATIENNFEVGAKKELPFKTIHCNMEDILSPWVKIVFHVPPEDKNPLMDWITKQNIKNITLTSSSENFVEILPDRCSKGDCLKPACKAAEIDYNNLYVIGDYYNDKEMLSMAVNSACPHNAPDDIKAICQIIVKNVDSGAVADYIDKI